MEWELSVRWSGSGLPKPSCSVLPLPTPTPTPDLGVWELGVVVDPTYPTPLPLPVESSIKKWELRS